jgi:hypothetical protein
MNDLIGKNSFITPKAKRKKGPFGPSSLVRAILEELLLEH